MKLSHINEKGDARMVAVDNKAITKRVALAYGHINIGEDLLNLILEEAVPKGDVLSVARIAGIMGVKETSRLIPMCHPLMIEGTSVTLHINKEQKRIEAHCEVKVTGKTGVEMEALTGVSIALLAIYDMCKAVDKSMVIEEIKLLKKTGGKSGTYEREAK